LNLDKLWSAISNEPVEQPAATEAFSPTTPNDDCQFDPDRYLLGRLRQTIDQANWENRPIQINYATWLILIQPQYQAIYLNTSLKDLLRSELIHQQDPRLNIKPINDDQAQAFISQYGIKRTTISNFLWSLGFITSKGQIPNNTRVDQFVFLRGWPNLTRLNRIPYDMQISALLARGPQSLVAISETLLIQRKYVFSFYTAAYAANLAGNAKRRSDKLVNVALSGAPKKRGLFRAILDRLGTVSGKQTTLVSKP